MFRLRRLSMLPVLGLIVVLGCSSLGGSDQGLVGILFQNTVRITAGSYPESVIMGALGNSSAPIVIQRVADGD